MLLECQNARASTSLSSVKCADRRTRDTGLPATGHMSHTCVSCKLQTVLRPRDAFTPFTHIPHSHFEDPLTAPRARPPATSRAAPLWLFAGSGCESSDVIALHANWKLAALAPTTPKKMLVAIIFTKKFHVSFAIAIKKLKTSYKNGYKAR